MRWVVEDGFENWVPDSVSIGDDGATVFAGLYINTPGLRLYSAGSPDPVFVTLPDVGLGVLQTQVAVAESAPLAVSLTTHDQQQVFQDPDILAVVRAYDPAGTGEPLWEHVLPESDTNTEPGIAVSDQGEVVVSWWSVEDLGGMLVTAWDGGGVQISQGVIPNPNGSLWPLDFELSRDGSTAMFSLPLIGKTVLWDVRSGTQLASVPDGGTFTGSAMSGDGRRVGGVRWEAGTYWMRVWELDAQDQPVVIFERSFPDSIRVTELAMDLDGSRLAWCVQEINPSDAFTLVLHELDSDVELFARTFAAPNTSLGLWLSQLRLDDTGETVATTNWGDSLDLQPEVIVLDDAGEVLVTADTAGSGLHLDLSRDGELLFAGAKGTHASILGSGGELLVIETRARALRLDGKPELGATLPLGVHADPAFGRALILASDGLLSEPFRGLRLDPTNGLRLVGDHGLSNGVFETGFRLPDARILAGTSLHLQGVLFASDLSIRTVTNTVSLRFLP